MFFKNLRIYKFTKPFLLSPEELEEKLAEHAFQGCGKHDQSKYGWVEPLGRHGQMLTHVTGEHIMICGMKEEKILPASVVNDAVQEKVEEIEAKQGRKIFRKEKLQLKDEVTLTLLPKAFSRTSKTFAYFSPKENLLVVNASSANKAEELLAYLRSSIESLPVIPPNTKLISSDVMTLWLQNQAAAEHFDINQQCELYDPAADSNVIRCKGQDLYSDEVAGHLAAGKQVKNLGVLWKDSLSCVIGDDLTVKSIKFTDMFMEKAGERDAESAAEQFDQDFAVMSLELSRFIKHLFGAFGGLQEKVV
ncbi:recombination-associated protein RdgC [Gammaproteobacteria bacterium 42_54_T18]|nr:recombination-associated protein RdgC [Gammaproteobacteria bacterium 42_54_T18]